MSEVFQLAILLSLRDLASGNLDHVADKLRATGKEGRATLKTFEELRKDFRQGLQLAGIGVAGIAAMRGGIKVAASLEESLLDLKSAFQEVETSGSVNLTKLGDQMNRAERLGVDLGNKLQGTTQDYLEIFASLRKAGVEVETILGGAGRAAGNLANVSGAIRTGMFREQAKELGQFGKMFKLKPEEFEQSVNLISALKDRFDIESGSLIESAKYFLATASSLKMTGLAGAEEILKVFALLKRNAALEGSQAGTSLTSLFQQFVTQPKQLQKLKKETGVDLQLFDGKKQFVGWERLFGEAEKLRKLPEKTRLEVLNKAFGEQGAKAFGAFVDSGVTGWRDISAEAKKAVPVNEKIDAQMATYNAKVEALQGSFENLVATAFTPMLDTLKPIVDNANKVVGAIQGWSKAHETTTSLITHLVGLGSVALVVVGGFKSMRAAWGLWKIASAVGGGESALLRFFRDTRVGADAAGDGMVGAATKAKGLRGRLASMPAAVSTSITLVGVEYAISKTLELYGALRDYQEALDDLHSTGVKGLETHKRLEAELAKRGQVVPEQITKTTAATAFASLNINDQLVRGLRNDLSIYMPFAAQRPYSFLTTGFDPKTAGKVFRERAPELEVASVMKEFVSQLKTKIPEGEQRDKVMKALEAGFPETFRTVQVSLMELRSPADDLRNTLVELRGSAGGAELKLKQIAAMQFPTVGTLSTGGAPVVVSSRAMGGEVQSEGMVNVHPGERIIPARVTRGLRDASSVGRGGDTHIHVNGGITVNVPAGSPAAEDPEAFFDLVTRGVEKRVRRQKERR